MAVTNRNRAYPHDSFVMHAPGPRATASRPADWLCYDC